MDNIFSKYNIEQFKKKNERAELVKFFVENLYDKNKKPFPVKRIAITLSHIPTKDLYFMQSVFKDTQNRNGNESANKWFWWSLKVKTWQKLYAVVEYKQ